MKVALRLASSIVWLNGACRSADTQSVANYADDEETLGLTVPERDTAAKTETVTLPASDFDLRYDIANGDVEFFWSASPQANLAYYQLRVLDASSRVVADQQTNALELLIQTLPESEELRGELYAYDRSGQASEPVALTFSNLPNSYRPGALLYQLSDMGHEAAVADWLSALGARSVTRMNAAAMTAAMRQVYAVQFAEYVNLPTYKTLFEDSDYFAWVDYDHLLANDPVESETQVSAFTTPSTDFMSMSNTVGDCAAPLAILDSGIDLDHPALGQFLWHNEGEDIDADGAWTAADENSVDDDGNGYVDDFYGYSTSSLNSARGLEDNDVNDYYGHGTHVSGIALEYAAAIDSNVPFNLMPVRVLDDRGLGYISDFYDGIRYALANGARVMNASLGWERYTTDCADASMSASVYPVIEEIEAYDALLVAAAGNYNTDTLYVPAGFNSGHVVAVAALSGTSTRASFSNYGCNIKISAPGVTIYSTTNDGSYGYMSGTSMSAPAVAGLLGREVALYPSTSASDLTSALYATADDLDTAGWDEYTGYGLMDDVETESTVSSLEDGTPVCLEDYTNEEIAAMTTEEVLSYLQDTYGVPETDFTDDWDSYSTEGYCDGSGYCSPLPYFNLESTTLDEATQLQYLSAIAQALNTNKTGYYISAAGRYVLEGKLPTLDHINQYMGELYFYHFTENMDIDTAFSLAYMEKNMGRFYVSFWSVGDVSSLPNCDTYEAWGWDISESQASKMAAIYYVLLDLGTSDVGANIFQYGQLGTSVDLQYTGGGELDGYVITNVACYPYE